MEITAEDREELTELLEISKNKIPQYVNLINSARADWDINNLDDCVFGMVFRDYVNSASEFLKNKAIDEAETNTVENTMEAFDVAIDVLNDHVGQIKSDIAQASLPR